MADEKNTIVGESMAIKGEISGDQDLILYGRVEGEIKLTKDLFIRPPSQTNANVKARNVTVSGRLEGNLDADQKVEISAEGRVVGDIRSPRIVIVDGAYFKGNIDMGDETNRATPAHRPEEKSKEQGPPQSPAAQEGPAVEDDSGKPAAKDRRIVVPDTSTWKKK